MLRKIGLKLYLGWAVFNFAVIMTISLPLIVVPSLIGGRAGRQVALFFLKGWGFMFGVCSGIRFKTVNRSSVPRNQPFVYVCNHNSYLDSPAFVLAIPGEFRPLGKTEMKKIPIFGWIYPHVVVMVDRSSTASRRESIRQLKEKLKQGISVFIFPEGSMNRSPETLLPFHDGAFYIAVETQTPIMPMVILNSRRLMPRDEFQPHPGTIYTQFLEPVSTQGLQRRDVPALKQRVWERMRQEIERHQSDKPAYTHSGQLVNILSK